ncbi:MAG: caspase family protein [Gallionella sp.]|jgi:hypothetical protein
MNFKSIFWIFWAALFLVSPTHAQFMRPPAFMGGIPGKAQFQAIQMQRHQARTLLYREALEELRKNPQAADVPECPRIATATRTLCIRRSDIAPSPAIETVIAAASAASATRPAGVAHKRIAVLIGNNGYTAPIPTLGTPIADVDQIAEVLRTRFGYETQILHDAGKTKIIETFNKIAEETKPEDSVLLFYAGHGYLMDDTKLGFWIPVDGSVRSAANWISNTDITKLLKAIPAQQVILISDSCFSGSLTREQKITDSLTKKSADISLPRSVLAFSSGGEEPVSDEGLDGHSIFAWHFIKTMSSINKGTAAGFDIYRVVHDGVKKDYPQEPQYGAVYSAGHISGGEYLFNTK